MRMDLAGGLAVEAWTPVVRVDNVAADSVESPAVRRNPEKSMGPTTLMASESAVLPEP